MTAGWRRFVMRHILRCILPSALLQILNIHYFQGYNRALEASRGYGNIDIGLLLCQTGINSNPCNAEFNKLAETVAYWKKGESLPFISTLLEHVMEFHLLSEKGRKKVTKKTKSIKKKASTKVSQRSAPNEAAAASKSDQVPKPSVSARGDADHEAVLNQMKKLGIEYVSCYSYDSIVIPIGYCVQRCRGGYEGRTC
jgi:hypothetical protein